MKQEIGRLDGKVDGLRQEINSVRQEMKQEVNNLRQEMKEENTSLRQEMKQETGRLDSKVEEWASFFMLGQIFKAAPLERRLFFFVEVSYEKNSDCPDFGRFPVRL
ncbi:MAG: hypothetical protein ACPLQP_09585 [Moorellaceae bacterium]